MGRSESFHLLPPKNFSLLIYYHSNLSQNPHSPSDAHKNSVPLSFCSIFRTNNSGMDPSLVVFPKSLRRRGPTGSPLSFHIPRNTLSIPKNAGALLSCQGLLCIKGNKKARVSGSCCSSLLQMLGRKGSSITRSAAFRSCLLQMEVYSLGITNMVLHNQ